MKRLLAAGIGPIYQICKVFRDGERGRLHYREFSLLEWYRPGFDSQRLMDEVAALIRHLAGTDLAEQRLTYGQLFQNHLGLDPHSAGPGQLQTEASRLGIAGADQLDLPDRGRLAGFIAQPLHRTPPRPQDLDLRPPISSQSSQSGPGAARSRASGRTVRTLFGGHGAGQRFPRTRRTPTRVAPFSGRPGTARCAGPGPGAPGRPPAGGVGSGLAGLFRRGPGAGTGQPRG